MYSGYDTVQLSQNEMAQFYQGNLDFSYLLENQYLIVKDWNGNVVDKVVKRGGQLVPISYKPIHSVTGRTIKPRNLEQELAFDMLQDPTSKIKVLSGPYGSGKDYCMVSLAANLVEKNKFEKIVFVRNNVEVRDTEKLGSLPGDETAKLMPYLMVMADHLGGVEELEEKIKNGRIEPIHLGYLRGRDLKNSIIYCTEAQNLSIDHMKLLIGRVGEGSELWINGDFKAQVDNKIFEKNNGIRAAIEKLGGNPYFAYVQLIKSERSPVAALADLLD